MHHIPPDFDGIMRRAAHFNKLLSACMQLQACIDHMWAARMSEDPKFKPSESAEFKTMEFASKVINAAKTRPLTFPTGTESRSRDWRKLFDAFRDNDSVESPEAPESETLEDYIRKTVHELLGPLAPKAVKEQTELDMKFRYPACRGIPKRVVLQFEDGSVLCQTPVPAHEPAHEPVREPVTFEEALKFALVNGNFPDDFAVQ